MLCSRIVPGSRPAFLTGFRCSPFFPSGILGKLKVWRHHANILPDSVILSHFTHPPCSQPVTWMLILSTLLLFGFSNGLSPRYFRTKILFLFLASSYSAHRHSAQLKLSWWCYDTRVHDKLNSLHKPTIAYFFSPSWLGKFCALCVQSSITCVVLVKQRAWFRPIPCS